VAVRITFGGFCFCLSFGRRSAALWVVLNKERTQGNLLSHGWALWGSETTHELAQTTLQFDDNPSHQRLSAKNVSGRFGLLSQSQSPSGNTTLRLIPCANKQNAQG
jgi:hypothetical protein